MNNRAIWRLIVAVIVLLATPAIGSAQQAPANGLTAEEALETAMAQNPDLRAAMIEWRRAKLSVVTEEHAFYPGLFAEGGYTTGRRPGRAESGVELLTTDSFRMATGLNQRFSTGTEVSAALEAERAVQDSVQLGNLGETYGLGVLFEITQPWLRGFGRDVNLAALHAAELREDAALAERDDVASDLAMQVLTGYWDLWFAQHQLEITRSAIATAEQELAQATERLDVGLISEADLIPLQTEMARQNEALVSGRVLVEEAVIELARLLGIDAEATNWQTVDEPPALGEVPTLAAAVATAEARHELRQLGLTADIAELDAAVAENQSLPRLDSVASLEVSGLGNGVADPFEQIGELQATTAFVGLRLELPLFDDGLEAAAERASLAVDSARATYEAAKDRLQAQVASTLNQLEAGGETLELARTTAELADRQVEVQTTLFENGKATMLDVVEAIQQQKEAELRILDTRVDIARLRLSLMDITGTLLETLSVDL